MNCKEVSVGDVYGRLTVSSLEHTYVLCLCTCGTFTRVLRASLKSGNTKSCGCLQREKAARNGDRNRTHGLTKTPTYHIWQGAKRRCDSERNKDYSKYGGRGIRMCDRWINSFENFLEDMGERPEGMTLERLNVNGPYSPDNCEWATRIAQTRNRRTSINVTYQGRTQPLTVWCDELGMDYSSAHRQLRRNGLPAEEAFMKARRV